MKGWNLKEISIITFLLCFSGVLFAQETRQGRSSFSYIQENQPREQRYKDPNTDPTNLEYETLKQRVLELEERVEKLEYIIKKLEIHER